MKEFYQIRLKLYKERKDYRKEVLEAEALKLENQARYILELSNEKIKLSK